MQKQTRWIIIGAIAVIVTIAGILYYLNRSSAGKEQEQLDALNKALEESANASDLNLSSNPAENLPDTNPVDKTNPFKNVKTNPFQ